MFFYCCYMRLNVCGMREFVRCLCDCVYSFMLVLLVIRVRFYVCMIGV